MILYILAQSVPKFTAYKVDLDAEFVIPIFYLVPLILCLLLHKFAPKILYIVAGLIFTLSLAFLAFVLYKDYAIWKFVMPVIAVLGGLSGLSGWVRFLIKKIKNIGDDDSYIS